MLYICFCVQRGWTAWSHAHTDRRVVATIPLVFSLLKTEETMMQHYRYKYFAIVARSFVF